MSEEIVRKNRATNKVKIIMTKHGIGSMWLDGVEVRRVVSCDFSTRVGDLNRLTVQFLANDVEIDAPVDFHSSETNWPPNNMIPRTLDHKE